MLNTVYEVAAVVVIGTPILAWVVRIERKLKELCVTLKHIKYHIDKEEEDGTPGE